MKRIHDKKVLFFSNRLRERVRGVRRVILFGSHARGDARDGSDYDFAVVLEKKSSKILDDVRMTEVEFLNKFDTLSSSIVFNETEWQKHKKLPIGLNIEREGIQL